MRIDKRALNIFLIVILTYTSFIWTFWVFHKEILFDVIAIVAIIRIISSIALFQDYSLSWSKASQKTFILKSFVYIAAFCIYMPYFHGTVRIALFLSELFLFLLSMNFLMYSYYLYINRNQTKKTQSLVIYGAGKAGLRLSEEYKNSKYDLKYYIDDEVNLQKRSVDGVKIVSIDTIEHLSLNQRFDLLAIAMPSAEEKKVKEIYDELKAYFHEIKILPSLNNILQNRPFAKQLKDISVEDLLARYPKDLDRDIIGSFLKDKKVLVTGAGGSIGSEISRQCIKYGVKELYLLDHSEYNLYAIAEELEESNITSILQNILDKKALDATFAKLKPDIIVHAAAYKHVHLVELNKLEGIKNNILGTKNTIDLAVKHSVEKFILISTDKAVRPTNVMGVTKRICELYAGNVDSKQTQIVSVRFGNVLGSSGSVIPKFRTQIQRGGPVTVTHPEVTRYFMLIPEACELVLQTGAIAKDKEICILDMGEPVKIVDLAKKMIELSGRENIDIKFTGLRAGEKLYEELLINESDKKTQFESITVTQNLSYDIEKLNQDIDELLNSSDQLKKLQEIVPEFSHQSNI